MTQGSTRADKSFKGKFRQKGEFPDLTAIKRSLVWEITDVLTGKGWTGQHSSEVLHTSRSQIFKLRRGMVDRFSLDGLLCFLLTLDHTVTLIIKPLSGSREMGACQVFWSDGGLSIPMPRTRKLKNIELTHTSAYTPKHQDDGGQKLWSLKVALGLEITEILSQCELSQVKAALFFGTTRAHFINLNKGNPKLFSLDRLVRYLLLLGQDLHIVLSPKKRGKGRFVLQKEVKKKGEGSATRSGES